MGYRFNAKALRIIKETEHWTLKELALHAECSEAQMSRLVHGQRGISARALAGLEKIGITAERLDVDLAHPMGKTDSQWW